MRLSSAPVRSMHMTGAIAGIWEGRVGIEAAVLQLRRGDLDALSTLIARYQNRLYRYLLRLVRQPAEAEDLFQQTWVRVAEKIRTYDPSRNFDAWLFTLARNLAFDHLRRVRPNSLDEPARVNSADESMISRLASADPGPLDQLLARERAGYLVSALENLPVIYREVLSLRFEEEMKLEEIAAVLAVPLSTVKSRLRRSLVQLRWVLETAAGFEVQQ
jgi:RNA polymerase sigma-70 factor (ECF subfamily)